MDTIEQLKLKIAELEAENKQLRTLLKLPVKYSESVVKEDNVYDQNQSKRIIRYSITKDAANYFYSLFWGRKDVYALRVVNKNTGKAAYYPQRHYCHFLMHCLAKAMQLNFLACYFYLAWATCDQSN